jgi:hypothetical protein
MAPFGTYTKAMRGGAAFFAMALAKAGLAESKVGSVMQAPSPRSTWRRDRTFETLVSRVFFMSVRCGDGGLGTHLLERRESMTPINSAENLPSLSSSRFTIRSMVSTS